MLASCAPRARHAGTAIRRMYPSEDAPPNSTTELAGLGLAPARGSRHQVHEPWRLRERRGACLQRAVRCRFMGTRGGLRASASPAAITGEGGHQRRAGQGGPASATRRAAFRELEASRLGGFEPECGIRLGDRCSGSFATWTMAREACVHRRQDTARPADIADSAPIKLLGSRRCSR